MSRTRAARVRRLVLENLEDRRLLSAAALTALFVEIDLNDRCRAARMSA